MSLLLVVLAIVAGSLIVGGTVVYFLRARYREAVEPTAPRPSAPAPSSAPTSEDIRAIGDQIERSMAEQRLQGETQRQLLAQKLDAVRQTMEAQRTHVDGIRSELRHETQRREAEMAEIRQQIGALQQTAQLQATAPAALPPAQELPPAPLGTSTFEDVDFGAAPTSRPADSPAAELPLADEPPAESLPLPDTFQDVAFEDVAPSASPETFTFEEISFDDFSFDAPSGDSAAVDVPAPPRDDADDDLFESWTPTAPALSAPYASAPPTEGFADSLAAPHPTPPAAPAPAPEMTWIARSDRPESPAPASGLLDLDALAVSPSPEPVAAPTPVAPDPMPPVDAAPFVAPEGAEDLTVISSIDDDAQRLLYQAGVTSLEEIAQWGRTDARRVSAQVEVSEDTIMNVWVFEAQAALFNRYTNG